MAHGGSSNRFAARRRKSQGSPSRVAPAFHRGDGRVSTVLRRSSVLPLFSGDALDPADGAGRPSRARPEANGPAVRRAVFLRFGRIAMHRISRGFGLVELVIVVVILGVLVTVVVFAMNCSGTCTSVQCSETAPCTFCGATYTIGTACAAGVAGTVCEKHFWPFADCKCADTVRPGNVLKAVCIK
jgi:prepilin-type N-terminal cleavage/methylation domain-containing protein